VALAVTDVVDLGDIRAADAGRVGPKMARLGQLAAEGWRVPDGYAVSASALDGWLPAPARSELARLFSGPDNAGPGGLSELAGRARALVESQPLPSSLADAVAAAHERLAARTGRGDALRVAVRSSAVSEDGHTASFAGQYETYLGVSGVGDVLAHIVKCWASGFSAHALTYRRRFGGAAPVRGHDLAVGVLELVDARSAGVAFTLDPVTGDRGVCVVEGNWGFGESVVSGHVTPDHWTVDRDTGRVLTARVGAKLTWAAAEPESGRVVLSPLPDDLIGEACLTDEEVRHICAQAAAIESAAGGVPQDVEWAVAWDLPFPDCVYILQHRPETTWSTSAGSEVGSAAIPGASAVSGASPASGTSPASRASAASGAAKPAFDPVQYALRNVFKVPGS
jgi:pyruvate, water dikinase